MIPEASSVNTFVVAARLQGFSVSVRCPTPVCADLVRLHLSPWVVDTTAHGTIPDVVLTIANRDGDSGFSISNDNTGAIARAHSLSTAIVEVQACLDEEALRRTPFFPVHAGVAARDGRAVLIVGKSRSGKTTLVEELGKHGATYFSDEFALLDREGRVHPYPRPLLVRVPHSAIDERRPVAPSEVSARVGSSPVPVALILSMAYAESAELDLERMPASDAVMTLLQNTPCVIGVRPQLTEAFARATRTATAYRGVRGDATRAASRILELLA